jgi:RNA polymerase sigma factor (sigma-70 family)
MTVLQTESQGLSMAPPAGHFTPDEHPGRNVADLVHAAQAGDAAAFSALVGEFQALVRRVAFAVTRNPDDTSDAVQQTWLILLRKIGSIECADALPGWLSTTARREALRLVRERARHQPLDETILDHTADTSDGPERQAEMLDLVERVDRALLSLPRQRREFLIDLVGHRVPYSEVADRFQFARGSLGPLRARYLRDLSAALEECGATAA